FPRESRGLCGERQVGGDGGAAAWFAVQGELAAASLRLAGSDVGGGERELYAQAGPRPARAVEKDPAAERLHPVLEADQAGAAGEVGAARAVVTDHHAQDFTGGLHLDADRRGACVEVHVAGEVLPGGDPPDRAEVVHESARTRVTRLFFGGRTVIR